MTVDDKRPGGVEDEEGAEDEDLYAVLGLTRDCSDGDLRAAYKKLALRWHPDRCADKESKAKFQAIQEAYSVLSDSNKRFMYDCGVYDDDDDDDNDHVDDGGGKYTMCDFLGEMAAMMQQNKPSDTAEGSFEELQQLFLDMYDSGNQVPSPISFEYGADSKFDAVIANNAGGEADFLFPFSPSSSSSSSCSSFYAFADYHLVGCKRGAAVSCDPVVADVATGFSDLFDSYAHAFFGGPAAVDSASSTAGSAIGEGGGVRRVGRKQKVSLSQDVSSEAAEVVSAASY